MGEREQEVRRFGSKYRYQPLASSNFSEGNSAKWAKFKSQYPRQIGHGQLQRFFFSCCFFVAMRSNVGAARRQNLPIKKQKGGYASVLVSHPNWLPSLTNMQLENKSCRGGFFLHNLLPHSCQEHMVKMLLQFYKNLGFEESLTPKKTKTCIEPKGRTSVFVPLLIGIC